MDCHANRGASVALWVRRGAGPSASPDATPPLGIRRYMRIPKPAWKELYDQLGRSMTMLSPSRCATSVDGIQ